MGNKGFTLIELMVVVMIIGLLAVVTTPQYMRMQDRAKESAVTSNAHTVQLAVEDFSVQNQGRYSADQLEIQPLLPHGNLLANPFTGATSEPQFGAVAGVMGQVGLVGSMAAGVCVGYNINGWGRDSQVVEFSSGQN